jgi:hypothetical protein
MGKLKNVKNLLGTLSIPIQTPLMIKLTVL